MSLDNIGRSIAAATFISRDESSGSAGCAGSKERVPPDSNNTDRTQRSDGRQVAGTRAAPSAATLLVDLALDRFTIGISEDGEPFAFAKSGPRIARLLRGGKSSLRAELAKLYRTQYGKVPPSQALADAMLVLEGEAQDTDPTSLPVRVAECGGSIYFDLGDATGRAIRLDAAGWEIVDRAPVLFKRTALTGVVSEPHRVGDLDQLWAGINVAKEDRPLVLAFMIAAFLPNIAHPILDICGEHGTAKSTTAKRVGSLLDPCPTQNRKAPSEETWVMTAAGSWVVSIDNISVISDALSDSLCRAVTGDADVRRRLYSDADLTVFAFRRVIILNGIDHGSVRGDLADRLLPIMLEVIDAKGRRTDSALDSSWHETYPSILGAVLDLAARVLAVLPGVELDELPRMADFARVLQAVDEICGTNGLSRYLDQGRAFAAGAVAGSAFLRRLEEVVDRPFTGSSAQLLALVTPSEKDWRPPRDWPKHANAVTGLLRRSAPGLRSLAWGVVEGGDSHSKTIVWTLTPPSRDAPECDPHDPHDPQEADESPDHAGTSGQTKETLLGQSGQLNQHVNSHPTSDGDRCAEIGTQPPRASKSTVRRRGRLTTKSTKPPESGYRDQSDWVGQFLDETTEQAADSSWIKVGNLYDDWKEWIDTNVPDESPGRNSDFKRRLMDRGEKIEDGTGGKVRSKLIGRRRLL